MRADTMRTALAAVPCYYLTCCVLAVLGGMLTGGMQPGAIVPGMAAMVLFGWIPMLAALSGDTSLGDVRAMQIAMLVSLLVTPCILWFYRWANR